MLLSRTDLVKLYQLLGTFLDYHFCDSICQGCKTTNFILKLGRKAKGTPNTIEIQDAYKSKHRLIPVKQRYTPNPKNMFCCFNLPIGQIPQALQACLLQLGLWSVNWYPTFVHRK